MRVSSAGRTYWVHIYIAGDEADARRVCREFCYEQGECVSVTPTTYIYTGGEEAGVCVRFINYPRFTRSEDDIYRRAINLADLLMERLFQHSYTIESPQISVYVSRRKLTT